LILIGGNRSIRMKGGKGGKGGMGGKENNRRVTFL
jgi:hypothetical protein